MSTKTSIKRIALVAVAALGFGMVSTVAAIAGAQAAQVTSAATVGTASQTVRVGDTATTTIGFTTVVASLAADTQTYTSTSVAITKPTGSNLTLADNDGNAGNSDAAFATTGGTTNLGAIVTANTGVITGDAASADVPAGALIAGTISLVIDAPGTYTVTVTAGSSTAVATIVARSLSYTTGDAAAAAPYSTGTGVAGVGQLGATNSGATGNYLAVAAAAGTNSGPNDFYVYSDGRSGVGTVTIAVNGVTVATKAVTFYGSVASYTLTVKNKAIRVGDSADTQVLTVAALDANGVAVPSATVYVSSGSTSYATVDSATVTTASDGTAADIGINGLAKGSSVITVGNASSSATVSATATINVVTAGIASVALSFDKDEYAPGELVTVTVSAKNSDGVAAGDATYANLLTSAGLVGSVVLQGYTASASVALTDGAKSYTFYAPLIEGTVVVKGTLDTSVDADYQGLVVSKSFNVVAANGGTSAAIDAANEATDAANAAAEAADAATAAAMDAQAAVAALATQVASLIEGIKAQITTLTNLVIKIQKKVRA